MEIAVKIAHLASVVYRCWGGIFATLIAQVNRFVFVCHIPPSVYIPKNTILPHQGLGVVIHPNVVIGENVMIRQHVTIGNNGKEGESGMAPKIGNNVMIGAGACVLGPISIGNNVKIGANAVVLTDIPDNCVAVGVPAKIVKH